MRTVLTIFLIVLKLSLVAGANPGPKAIHLNSGSRVGTTFWAQLSEGAGFLTSLHVVAGEGKHIVRCFGHEDPAELRLEKVAIALDLAFLVPASLKDSAIIQSWGLDLWQIPVRQDYQRFAGKEVIYFGYGGNTDVYTTPFGKMGVENYHTQLSTVLPTDVNLSRSFNKRKSPALETKVLVVNSFGGKGYSGAPVACRMPEGEYRLLGLLAGGFALLEKGAQATVFVIPLSQEILRTGLMPVAGNQAYADWLLMNPNNASQANFWWESSHEVGAVDEINFETDKYRILLVADTGYTARKFKKQIDYAHRDMLNHQQDQVEMRMIYWSKGAFIPDMGDSLKEVTGADLVLFASEDLPEGANIKLEYYHQEDFLGWGFQFLDFSPLNPGAMFPEKQYASYREISADADLLVDFKLFREYYEAALNQNPSEKRTQNLLAAENALNNLQSTLDHIRTQFKDSSKVCPDALFGKLYLAWGREAEAKERFENACRICPNNVVMLQDYATWHESKGQIGATEQRLLQSLEISRGRRLAELEAISWIRLGFVWLKKQDLKKARAAAGEAKGLLKDGDQGYWQNQVAFLDAVLAMERMEYTKADSMFTFLDVIWVGERETKARALCLQARLQLNSQLKRHQLVDSLFEARISHPDPVIRADLYLTYYQLLRYRGISWWWAREYLDQAYEIMSDRSDQVGIGLCAMLYGDHYLKFDSLQGAENNLDIALRVFGELGDTVRVVSCLLKMAKLEVSRDQVVKAESLYREAESLSQKIASPGLLGQVLTEWGDFLLKLGHESEAHAILKKGMSNFQNEYGNQSMALAYRLRGEIAFLRQKDSLAFSFVNQGLKYAKEIGHNEEFGRSLFLLGKLHSREPFLNPDLADSLFEQAERSWYNIDHRFNSILERASLVIDHETCDSCNHMDSLHLAIEAELLLNDALYNLKIHSEVTGSLGDTLRKMARYRFLQGKNNLKMNGRDEYGYGQMKIARIHYAALGDLESELACCLELVKLDPDTSDAGLFRAHKICIELGRLKDAAHHIELSGDLDRERDIYSIALSSYQRAKNLYQKCEMERDINRVLRKEGEIHVMRGNYAEARRIYKKCIRKQSNLEPIDPDEITVLYQNLLKITWSKSTRAKYLRSLKRWNP